MALEYTLELKCAVRRRLPEQELRQLARLSEINAQFIEQSLYLERLPPPELMHYIHNSQAKLRVLDSILPVCRSCPANFTLALQPGTDRIGCMGKIDYPVDTALEHFLANRFQLVLDTTAAEDWPRALHALLDRDTPFDGELTKHLRHRKVNEQPRFFALPQPIPLARQAAHITTDNLFDLLSGFVSSDFELSGYRYELPVIVLADYRELLEMLFQHHLLDEERERLAANSRSFRQYLTYVEAIKYAEELQVRLLLNVMG
jgi:hypothetical protein